jgi:hypothetical protein
MRKPKRAIPTPAAMPPPLVLTPDEACVMVALGCTAEQARATLNEYEPIRLALAYPIPVGGGIVTAATLNVRASAGVSSPIIGKLAQDAVVSVWGRTPAGDMLAIREPLSGWVAAQWVEVLP